MQPQSPALVQHSGTDPAASTEATSTTQHGDEGADTFPISPLSGSSDEGGWEADLQQDADSHAAKSQSRFKSRSPSPQSTPHGLSHLQTPVLQSRNRIAEYENASQSSTPRKRTEGPAFEVIKKSRKPGDKRSPISELPNEILTHALAHLSPSDLSSISLVSRRFHELVTTPHAWRTAFSRYFPGPDSILAAARDDDEEETEEILRTERRAFARVTALASWRSEYILRTRLLRSLARGKPVQTIASPSAARTGQSHVATSIVMYNSQMFTTVNHMHAAFGSGLNKRPPRFVHGADDVGTASSSDPATGKIDSWGLGDPTTFIQFSDRYPGDAQYGLGPGEMVGVPNSMDVSQPYGMVHGEGSPEGLVYFRFTEEMRGRFLAPSTGLSVPELGIPKVALMREATCSVWIAKSSTIPSLTDGLIGILSGSSLGVLTAYSLGPLGARDQRFGRGEVTARWVLSPGVPIISIAVDEHCTLHRQARNRVWAVVLNALGEVFYLTKLPKRASLNRASRLDDEGQERDSWTAGRTVYWDVVEPSRRVARQNPYDDSRIDGSYSPRTSWNGMCLSKEQIQAETREIEDFLARKPKDFQKSCIGWDMRRRMEVDFAGDDGNNAGEMIVVFDCGLDEDSVSSAKRYTRCKGDDQKTPPNNEAISSMTDESTKTSAGPSLFGGSTWPTRTTPAGASPQPNAQASLSFSLSQDKSQATQSMSEEWRMSDFDFGGIKSVQIITTTLDCSTFATLTGSEDPLLNMSSGSTASSPSLTPLSQLGVSATSADIPGQRARFVAAGTKMGSVLVWNMRTPVSRSSDVINVVEPIRIIHTDSPEISCLALSSLYLVHGGNDGLVQAWDPLASNMGPIRTLNSRFSSRARRRLVQAQASPQGVGINLFAAGAICLDPDATVLRGLVSIGTHLRYWSYSSSAADQYKSHKRRLRRSERGSNIGGERVANAPRGNMKDYISSEKRELEQEAARHAREAAHLAGRFGTELLGSDASEEELLAYATMLSEEALAKDLQSKHNGPGTLNRWTETGRRGSAWSSDTATPEDSPIGGASSLPVDEVFDADVAEAIRISLENDQRAAEWEQEQGFIEQQDDSGFEIPIRYGKGRRHSPHKEKVEESSKAKELSDLEFALQLSMAEEASRREAGGGGEEVFPALSPAVTSVWHGKGKGKAD